MKVTIICVGKIKEKFYSDAIKEYEKRLQSYCTFKIVEVADEKTKEGASQKMNDSVKLKEAERLLPFVKDDDYVITLEILGKSLDSVEFAKTINECTLRGKSSIVFIIGGSLGLHENVVRRADFHLSFSKMTFPHQLMRVILTEQIYRAFRIINNEPYHK